MEANSKKQLQEANKAYAMGKFAEAEALYREVRAMAPNHPLILERLGLIALWRNDTQAAERCFQDALDAMPLYQRLWPLTAMLQYRLAMTYYRRDRFTEASNHLLKAAGPISLGPFGDMKALGGQASMLSGCPTYVIEGPEQSRISFIITDPLPVVSVSVNGGEPVNFLIDTGGAEVILDREYAVKIGVRLAGAFQATYAGNRKGETGVGCIDALQIGDFTIRNVPVHTLDVASMSAEFDGRSLHGIIGTRLLMHFLATIDYAGGALVMRRPTLENLREYKSRALAKGAKAIPFWLIDMHYVMAAGTANDREPTLFFVDTGLTGNGFTAAEPDLKAYGINVDWSKSTEGVGGGGKIKGTGFTVDKITLGTGKDMITEHNVLGTAIANSVPVLGNLLGFHVGGLISHQFFRKYALTLDFSGMQLFVE
jgi:hypothetical protein